MRGEGGFMLIMHQVVDLIYPMGHTFDHLGSTYIATEEFLTTNNPTVLGSRNDLALLQDVHDAAHLFSELAKMQLFGDGNKRTALLAANGLLLVKKSEHVLTIPVVAPDKRTFNELLSVWYTQGDPQVVDFLTSYNRKVCGLDRDGHPIEDAQ